MSAAPGRFYEILYSPAAQYQDMAVTKWSKIGHQLGVQSGDNILGNSLPKPQSSGLGPQPFL